LPIDGTLDDRRGRRVGQLRELADLDERLDHGSRVPRSTFLYVHWILSLTTNSQQCARRVTNRQRSTLRNRAPHRQMSSRWSIVLPGIEGMSASGLDRHTFPAAADATHITLMAAFTTPKARPGQVPVRSSSHGVCDLPPLAAALPHRLDSGRRGDGRH
jgi:hypothetical protein